MASDQELVFDDGSKIYISHSLQEFIFKFFEAEEIKILSSVLFLYEMVVKTAKKLCIMRSHQT